MIDVSSFFLVAAMVGVTLGVVTWVLRSHYPKDLGGLGEMASANFIGAGAFLLFALRGRITDILSVNMADFALPLSVALYALALSRLFGRRPQYGWWGGLLVFDLAGVAYFTWVAPNVFGRVAVLVFAIWPILVHCWSMVWRHWRGSGSAAALVSLVAFSVPILLLPLWGGMVHFYGSGSIVNVNVAQAAVLLILLAFSVFDNSLFLLMATEKLRDGLVFLASRDMLTGAYNRGIFREMAQRELARARRACRPLCLAMLDLDRFKAVNDHYGHAAGDAVLKGFASLVEAHMRPGDLFARVGGEEFCLLLPEIRGAEAFAFMERLRQAMAETPCLWQGESISVTVSIGLTEADPAAGLDSLLSRADAVLYRAKESRNATAMD